MSRALLKELIRSMLLVERMGSEFSDSREGLLAAIRTAQNNLKSYDNELKKKRAFDAALADFKKSMSDRRARDEVQHLQAQDPDTYLFDDRLLKKKRSTLENQLEKAYQVAFEEGVIDPETMPEDVIDRLLKNDKKHSKLSDEHIAPILPSEGAQPIFPIEKIEPMQFYAWNDPRWWRKIRRIKHGFTGKLVDDRNKDLRAEPGEDRLATIFGGAKQGSDHAYDIVTTVKPENNKTSVQGQVTISGDTKTLLTPDNRGGIKKWEVKSVGGASGKFDPEIRTSAKGMRIAKKAIDSLIAVMRRLRTFVNGVIEYGIERFTDLSQHQRIALKQIKEYIDDNMKNFESGEVSRGRMRKLSNLIENLQLKTLMTSWPSSVAGAKSVGRSEIWVGGSRYDLRSLSWPSLKNDIARTQQEELPDDIDGRRSFKNRQAAVETMRQMSLEDARRLLIRPLVDYPIFADFKDASKFFEEFESKIDIKSIFRGVEGVFIVTNSGFLLIPVDRLDEAFYFARFSQTRPILGLTPEVKSLLQFGSRPT